MPTANMKLAEYKALPQKRSKYRNTAVVIDGIRFASKREGKCWVELKALEYAKRLPAYAVRCEYRSTFRTGKQANQS